MTAKILIVEDEMLVAVDLEWTLTDLGYECVGIVPDLETARGYLGAPIDLALVDLNLRDGFTGPEIGAQLSAQGVAVLFVTANPALLEGRVAGAIGVITKPADEKLVEAAVEYALGARSGRRVTPPALMRVFN
ncbi:DNA-binding response OmpR family regulator [Polymorphobacter multimanifer]|uniref:DNA-binding response OmpR family regulator n=1 Tax=Polymorphobacter multimanifer TaxID=1070431 RepID=A0A841LAJ8_9SPHN|nr:response regulator [Polymorphobacter multimanifer]MBB6227993.1 DNA-binding response OmpR family regulator [Polymorphobacter multimanifer]